MNANRPRHSVLCLFDPLAASTNDLPSTPPREYPDSDKENNHLTLSVFFNRTSKQHSSSLLVSPLKKHLIDIGDETMEDASVIDLFGGDQELLRQEIESDVEQPQPHTPHLRSPLSELTTGDADATPLARLRAHPHQFVMSSLPSTMAPTLNEEHFPSHDSPSINRVSQATMSDVGDIPTPRFVEMDGAKPPRIVISCSSAINSPEKTSQSELHDNVMTALTDSPLDQKEQHSETSRDDPHPTWHLRAPKPALHDSNRFSVDLQASFQMYLQSDSSFDLLNDKISLIEPMECLTTDDEHFDFEVEKDKLQDAMAKFKRASKTQSNILPENPPACSVPLVQDCMSAPREPGIPDHPPVLPSDSEAQRVPSTPPDDSLDKPNKRWSTNSGIPSPTSYRPIKESSSSTIPQSKQRRMSSPLATPQRVLGVVPPPAVQALRIVKRLKARSESKDDSGFSASTAIATSTTRDTERLQARKNAAVGAAQVALPETKPLRVEPSSSRSSSTTKQARSFTSTGRAGAGIGPRRMPASDNRAESAASKPNLLSLPGSTLGPRRMQIISTEINVPTSKMSSMPSGLKQPSTSNLPKPSGMAMSSRLPGPIGGQQGTSKLRRPVAGTGKGNLPRRVVSGD